MNCWRAKMSQPSGVPGRRISRRPPIAGALRQTLTDDAASAATRAFRISPSAMFSHAWWLEMPRIFVVRSANCDVDFSKKPEKISLPSLDLVVTCRVKNPQRCAHFHIPFQHISPGHYRSKEKTTEYFRSIAAIDCRHCNIVAKRRRDLCAAPAGHAGNRWSDEAFHRFPNAHYAIDTQKLYRYTFCRLAEPFWLDGTVSFISLV